MRIHIFTSIKRTRKVLWGSRIVNGRWKDLQDRTGIPTGREHVADYIHGDSVGQFSQLKVVRL